MGEKGRGAVVLDELKGHAATHVEVGVGEVGPEPDAEEGEERLQDVHGHGHARGGGHVPGRVLMGVAGRWV